MIRLIYASNVDNIIGRNNRLPWHIPKDLQHFQSLTEGGVIVMGMSTWESLPGKLRPLKNRTNVVLTTDQDRRIPNVDVHHSLQSVLDTYPDVWVIGGGRVLRQTIDIADEIHLTLIHNRIDGDVRSPIIHPEKWLEQDASPIMTSGIYQFQYITYIRKPVC